MESIKLSRDDVDKMLRPCVYVFRLGDVAQYVGMSSRGFARPLTNKIMRRSGFKYDNLEVLWQETKAQARKTEIRLIYELSPKFNTYRRSVLAYMVRSMDIDENIKKTSK